MTLQLDIRAVAREEDNKGGGPVRFKGLAYSGGPLDLAGFAAPVVVELTSMEAPGPIPIVADHDTRIGARLGAAIARVGDGGLTIEGEIVPGTPEADRFISLIRSPGGASLSIGATAPRVERVPRGRSRVVNGRSFDGPIDVVRGSALREVSAVGVGADPGAVAVAARANLQQRNAGMTEEGTTVATAPDPVARERERVREINAAYFGIDGEDAHAERDGLIDSGATPDEARGAALARMRASMPTGMTGRSMRTAPPNGRPDTIVAAALLMHAGRGDVAERAYGAGVCQSAAALRASSMLDIAAASLRLEGRDVPGTRDDLIRAVAQSTSSFAVGLNGGVEKVALEIFQNAPEAWRSFARRVPVNNFRDHGVLRLGSDLTYEIIAPGGELKHGSLSESVVALRATTWGKIIGIDRALIINDDVSILDDVPVMLAQEAARTIGDHAHDALVAGITSGFFGAANNNLMTGAGSALSAASLADAVMRLRRMRDSAGRPLNMPPRFLLVSPEDETTARALLNSAEVGAAAGAPTGNALRGVADLLIDARMTPGAWALFARPSDNALIVGLLNGVDSPTVQSSASDFDRLGMAYRAFIDFGVTLGDRSATPLERAPFRWGYGRVEAAA